MPEHNFDEDYDGGNYKLYWLSGRAHSLDRRGRIGGREIGALQAKYLDLGGRVNTDGGGTGGTPWLP